jgi:peroxiredoxin
MRAVTIVSGVFLLVLSLLVFTDNLALLAQWSSPVDVNDTLNASTPPETEASPTAKTAPVAAKPPDLGSTAPDFVLDTLDGETVTLSDLRGQVVIINLWATWCVPCREEMPALESAWVDYQERGLVVLAVNQGESAERVRSFVDEQGWTLPVLLDPDEILRSLYQPRGYPTTYFIDRNGVIREIVFGGTLDEAAITQKITPLLEE